MTRPITQAERELLRSGGLLDIEDAFDQSAKVARAQAGTLVETVTVDKYSGRKTYEYKGDKKTWMSAFMPKETYMLDKFVVPPVLHATPEGETVVVQSETSPAKPSLLARLFGNGK